MFLLRSQEVISVRQKIASPSERQFFMFFASKLFSLLTRARVFARIPRCYFTSCLTSGREGVRRNQRRSPLLAGWVPALQTLHLFGCYADKPELAQALAGLNRAHTRCCLVPNCA